MKPRVLVSREISPEALARLKQHFIVDANQKDAPVSPAQLLRKLKGKDGLVSGPTEAVNDEVLAKNPQDPGVDISNIQKNIVYSIAHHRQDLGHDLTLDVGAIRLTILRVRIGPSQHLHPSIPAITVDVAVHGEIGVDLEGFTLVSLSLKNEFLTLEVGVDVDSTGSIVLRSWITDDPIDQVYGKLKLDRSVDESITEMRGAPPLRRSKRTSRRRTRAGSEHRAPV